MRPSSVVHTGVKSAGCENNTHHLQQSALLYICRDAPEFISTKSVFLDERVMDYLNDN
jgi:hypothetical protein